MRQAHISKFLPAYFGNKRNVGKHFYKLGLNTLPCETPLVMHKNELTIGATNGRFIRTNNSPQK